jgi:hypothetical protein
MTIFDDLHQIAALAGGEVIRSPIVEDEEIDPDQLRNSRGKRPSPWARSRSVNRRGTRA